MKKNNLFFILNLTFIIAFIQIGFSQEKSSLSDYQEYRDCCSDAALDLKNFKRNYEYNKVVEHVSYGHGFYCLEYIVKNYPEILSKIEKIKLNDTVGNPYRCKYSGFGQISPSTLRYAKIAGDLKAFFGSLDGCKILEIGAGYGGQAVVLSQMNQLGLYSLIDLPEVLSLQDKYLDKFSIPHQLIQQEMFDEIDHIDLLISNYAFTHFSKETQDLYLKKVISKATNGYMICTRVTEFYTKEIEALTKDEIIAKLEELGFYVLVVDENPSSFEGNFVLIFSKIRD